MKECYKNLIKIGSQSSNEGSRTIEVEFLGKKQKVLLISPYGIQAKAPNDTLVVLFAQQGREDTLLGYVTDPENRDDLEEGELKIGIPGEDANILFNADGDIIVEDKHGNTVTMDADGITLEDKNGNEISMESTKIVFNGGNAEILQ